MAYRIWVKSLGWYILFVCGRFGCDTKKGVNASASQCSVSCHITCREFCEQKAKGEKRTPDIL